jgi:glucose-6-phosphate dehydrogenase assembly protein OpcA
VEAAVTAAASAGSGRISEAVSRVEAELGKLWAAPEEGTGPAKVRASMMNLVVVSGSGEIPRLQQATDDLTQTHPGRVFLLTVDGRSEPWDLRTAISAVCRADGGALLCSDRVEIAFGAMVVPRAASVVAALALPEIPTVVEAAVGAPSALVDAVAKESGRVIVDSAHTSWKRIAELARAVRTPIADRNFVRSYSWRDLVARFFDDTPDAATAIRRVEIARTNAGKQEPAAVLLGWLASRLGWTFESGTRAKDRSGGAVEIALRADARTDLGEGEITSIRLDSRIQGRELVCTCARTEAPRMVRWTLEGARSAAYDHPLGFRDENWVLIKAIDGAVGDDVYRATALAAAAYCGCLDG